MKIKFSSPIEFYKENKKKILRTIEDVLDSNQYILGPNVKKLENSFSNFLGNKYSVGVANGTDALEIALRSIGVKKNDEVITVSHTAIATVSAIVMIGAKPVLIDVCEDDFNMDPQILKKNINAKTKAVIAVHIYGNPSKISEIKSICKKNKIPLIEDVSQAHGAEYDKKKLGTFGDVACFSCYPTKNLGSFGDAGLISTNNLKIYKKLKLFREYGWSKKNNSIIFGRNSRLDEIQASLINIKLKNLNKDNRKRKIIAKYYLNNLSDEDIILPSKHELSDHVYHIFAIRVKKRNQLIKYLNSKGIYPGIHYPIPIHKQKSFLKKYGKISLPVTEMISKEVLSLPIYPELKTNEYKYVVNHIKHFMKLNDLRIIWNPINQNIINKKSFFEKNEWMNKQINILRIINKKKKINLENNSIIFFKKNLKKYIDLKKIKKLEVLDFGGGFGLDYFNLVKNYSINIKNNISYTVIDLPKITSLANKFNKNHLKINNLKYCNNLNQIKDFDIFYSSNSIQYLKDTYKFFLEILKYKPKLIFLCGALTGNIPSFYTYQKYYSEFIKVRFLNISELNNFFDINNYKLVISEFSKQKYFGKIMDLPMNNFYSNFRIKRKFNLLYVRKK